jgi:hypothetical protein
MAFFIELHPTSDPSSTMLVNVDFVVAVHQEGAHTTIVRTDTKNEQVADSYEDVKRLLKEAQILKKIAHA